MLDGQLASAEHWRHVFMRGCKIEAKRTCIISSNEQAQSMNKDAERHADIGENQWLTFLLV